MAMSNGEKYRSLVTGHEDNGLMKTIRLLVIRAPESVLREYRAVQAMDGGHSAL